MSERMPTPLRITALFGWALMLGSLAATAIFWQGDRARAWPTPRWDARWFVAIGSAAGAGPAPRRTSGTPPDTAEVWVVAFQPQCSHCAESLEQASRLAAAVPAHPRLVLLAIDATRALAETTACRHPGVPVFWDARQVWRERWGHRIYGETLRFAADGAYRGLLETQERAANE